MLLISIKCAHALLYKRHHQDRMNRRFGPNQPRNFRILDHLYRNGIERWSYTELHLAMTSTADLSMQCLASGRTFDALQTWERALAYIAELKRRSTSSEKRKAELESILAAYAPHGEEMDEIKSDIDRGSSVTTMGASTSPDLPILRVCSVCSEGQSFGHYADAYSDDCEHAFRYVCDNCVYRHVKATLEDALTTSVVCPEEDCAAEFHYEGIRRAFNFGNDAALFVKYDDRITLECLRQTGEFVMCAHPDCKSGQFHDPRTLAHRVVTCFKCKRDTCSFHGCIWHAGMTCAQYDRRQVQDIPSMNWITSHTKRCPRCRRNIEKNNGCQHMTCAAPCRHQFCWECLADYALIQEQGLHMHRNTCPRFRPRQAASTPRSIARDDSPFARGDSNDSPPATSFFRGLRNEVSSVCIIS